MQRRVAWGTYESNPSASDAIYKLGSSREQPDAQCLEDMYGSDPLKNQSRPAFDIPDLRNRSKKLGVSSVGSANMEEREVSQEIERERKVKRPSPAQNSSCTTMYASS